MIHDPCEAPSGCSNNLNPSDRRGRVRGVPVLFAFPLIIAALLLNGPAHIARGAGDEPAERLPQEYWYVLEIGGAKAGHSHITILADDDQFLRSITETRLSIVRGRTPIDIAVRTEFVETWNGRPISMMLRQELSNEPIETTWTFTDDDVRRDVAQGGRTTSTTLPAPEGVWLPPCALRRFILRRMEAGAAELTYRTLDPQAGLLPVTVTSRRTGDNVYDLDGREIPVSVWSTTSDLLPAVSIEWYSTDGHLVRQELPSGLGTLVTRLSTREDVLNAGDGKSPELLLRTFVVPDRPIDDVMRATTATFQLRATDGRLPDLPAAGVQRVERIDEGTVHLRIDTIDPLPAGAGADDVAFRDASSVIDSDDQRVRRLADRALASVQGSKVTRRDQASAMRRFVSRYVVDKSLDQAFATASETARSRAGDCSEHAVLLAAMLRAADIPSRVATGLIYVDEFAGERGIFGWHMWTQALINDRWVDLDATIPVDFHAGHILVATSALGDGAAGLDLASLIGLMGNVEISVLDVDHHRPMAEAADIPGAVANQDE